MVRSRRQALAILGVPEDATDDDINKKIRVLLQRNHPDRGGDYDLFQLVNEAKNYLKKVAPCELCGGTGVIRTVVGRATTEKKCGSCDPFKKGDIHDNEHW